MVRFILLFLFDYYVIIIHSSLLLLIIFVSLQNYAIAYLIIILCIILHFLPTIIHCHSSSSIINIIIKSSTHLTIHLHSIDHQRHHIHPSIQHCDLRIPPNIFHSSNHHVSIPFFVSYYHITSYHQIITK